MRPSRLATAAPRLRAVVPFIVLSAAVCLSAAACHSPAPVAGAAYGTTSAAPTATTATMPATAAKTQLTVRETAIGYVLATSSGRTVYWYARDVKGSGKSACTGSCLTAWPAVTGAPAAASGVRLAGQLATITRPGGVVQATYNGYPLYTYAGDMAPGQTTGNGVGGVWHVITGDVLSPSPASAAAASLRDTSPTSGATPASSPTSAGYGGY
jgi:predicted lipoprotein with Yx(FWY)xxD motif